MNLSELVYLTSLLNSQGLMSDGFGAGQWDEGWKTPRLEFTGFRTRDPCSGLKSSVLPLDQAYRVICDYDWWLQKQAQTALKLTKPQTLIVVQVVWGQHWIKTDTPQNHGYRYTYFSKCTSNHIPVYSWSPLVSRICLPFNINFQYHVLHLHIILFMQPCTIMIMPCVLPPYSELNIHIRTSGLLSSGFSALDGIDFYGAIVCVFP